MSETLALTQAERIYLVNKLELTKEKLTGAIKDLSTAQLEYKPTPENWNINEILEHIALAENGIWQAVKQGLPNPPDATRRHEVTITDDDLYEKISSREHKRTSPDVIKPTGKFATAEAALALFTKKRNTTIEYVKTTEDDLRNRYWKHPATGLIDLYQTIIFIAAHSNRHIEQILEVKQGEGFMKQ